MIVILNKKSILQVPSECSSKISKGKFKELLRNTKFTGKSFGMGKLSLCLWIYMKNHGFKSHIIVKLASQVAQH